LGDCVAGTAHRTAGALSANAFVSASSDRLALRRLNRSLFLGWESWIGTREAMKNGPTVARRPDCNV